MNIENKIEITRCILISAANMNMNKENLLKISEKMDRYIIEYYDAERKKNGINK